MLKLGEKQVLEIVKKVEFGVYLYDPKEGNTEERVLLPIKQVPKDAKQGDQLEVFLYKDSKDRLIATTNTPLLEKGKIACLEVADINKMGAFLNWGLEKDLFLPYREQTRKVSPKDQCLVTLYIDKSERLCATMKIYHVLQTDSPYKKEDKVEGMVYEISPNFGAFVAVDDSYSALIPKKECVRNITVGERIKARVTAVKEDGKLDLSLRERIPEQMIIDGEKVLSVIESFDGALPFNDKASPEVIKREMGMSKNEFKRAVGYLLKNGKIQINEKSIRLK